MKNRFNYFKSLIINFSIKYSESFTTISWLSKQLNEDDILSEKLKIYLTMFSNLGRKTTTHSEHRNMGADVSGKKVYAGFDFVPFKKLPDIRSFTIKLKGLDWLFAMFGIKKNWEPTFTFKSYKNDKMNRYLWICLKRLNYHLSRGDYFSFWKLAMLLLRCSKVFFIVQWRHVNLNWHRNLPYSKVIVIYKKFRRIARNLDYNINYKRVYIDKSSDKARPLGVPTWEWRVYLSLLNNFVWMGIKDKMPEGQHGFQPRKGTLTAWKQFFMEAVKAKNIFEFDLEKFFDTVDLKELFRILFTKYQLPRSLAEQLLFLNMKLPSGMLLIWDPQDVPERIKAQVLTVMSKYGLGVEDMERFLSKSEYDIFQHLHKLKINKKAENWLTLKLRGVAQGAPTSPLLSMVALNETLFQTKPKNLSMYADDGYFFFDSDKLGVQLGGNLGYGVKLNMKKSGWVKKDGVWLKPFKFLGLEFDGIKNELRARTRKGSELIYSMDQLVRLLRLREILTNYPWREFEKRSKWVYGSFNELVNSSVWGLIQNRLYSGDYTLKNLEQDFRYTFINGSWSEKKGADLNIFISTSFATKDLADKLRGLRVPKFRRVTSFWNEFYSRWILLGGVKTTWVPIHTPRKFMLYDFSTLPEAAILIKPGWIRKIMEPGCDVSYYREITPDLGPFKNTELFGRLWSKDAVKTGWLLIDGGREKFSAPKSNWLGS